MINELKINNLCAKLFVRTIHSEVSVRKPITVYLKLAETEI